jgi:hypothetical protein
MCIIIDRVCYLCIKVAHFVGLQDPLQRQAGAKRGSKRISIFLEIRAGSAYVQKVLIASFTIKLYFYRGRQFNF